MSGNRWQRQWSTCSVHSAFSLG